MKLSTKNKTYTLGNCLRGYTSGEFSSLEEAWSYLSNRFLLSYPSVHGRTVQMTVREINSYGLEDNIFCKEGITEINDLNKPLVLKRCSKVF